MANSGEQNAEYALLHISTRGQHIRRVRIIDTGVLPSSGENQPLQFQIVDYRRIREVYTVILVSVKNVTIRTNCTLEYVYLHILFITHAYT